MEDKHTIKVSGKAYPARFTARVAVKAAERRGSLNNMLRNQNEAEVFEDTIWLAAELIRAGTKMLEQDEGVKPEKIPTMDDLLDTIDFNDLLDVRTQVMRVMAEEKPTVKAEGDSKNTDATPGT